MYEIPAYFLSLFVVAKYMRFSDFIVFQISFDGVRTSYTAISFQIPAEHETKNLLTFHLA